MLNIQYVICDPVHLTIILSNERTHIYRPQRSCGQGNVFTGVCHSFCSQGGSASVHAGIPPPRTRQTPPGADSPGPGRPPPPEQTPPDLADPPWKQTPSYGLRAAGTHPTGMHCCYTHAHTDTHTPTPTQTHTNTQTQTR